MHRLKADEAYEVGKPGEPIRSYLNIEAIVELAKAKEVDAIHPGYGFLSENAEFARACAAAGHHLRRARGRSCSTSWATRWPRESWRARRASRCSREATRPVMPGPEAHALAESLGYPVIVKASMGGGGRGMRVVESADGARCGARPGAARGGHGLRRSRRLHREVRPQGQAHRGAAPGRPARQPRASLRARLLGAAPASEDRRDCAGAQPRPGGARRRSATPPCGSAGTCGTRTPARSSSWSTSRPARSTSSRSIRASRSSTPSPRWSPASTWSRARS